jgi:Protein of unknown function (DUF2971)
VERGRAAVAGAVSHVIRALSERLGQEDVKVPPPAVEESRAEPERRTPSKLKLTIRTQNASGRWRKVSAGRLHNRIQHKRMTEMYRILDKSFGVLCLSRHSDNIRLWSHYASNHSGLCLEFDAAAHPAAFPRLHEVVYQTPYPVIPPEFPDLLQAFRDKATDTIAETLLNVADVLANDLSGDKKETTPETAAALGLARWFYVKSSSWNYEKEWRCLKWKPGPQPFPPEALTRIIAGCTNTDATLALVRDAISGTALRNVPLFKAVRKARKFGLDIVPAA